MSLSWIPFATAAILLYGIGQGLSKEGTSRVGSPVMLVVFAINAVTVWGGYWLVFHRPVEQSFLYLYGFSAAFLSAWGYVFYYEALAKGNVSVVGTVTAAFPAVTVVLAWLFLGEHLLLPQKIAVFLIVASIVFFSYEKKTTPSEGKGWIMFMLLSSLFWGGWAVVAKVAVDRIGQANLLGSYACVGPAVWVPYWLFKTKGKLRVPLKALGRPELAVLCFCFAAISMYGALARGYVSIVTPVVDLYPLVTILYARIWLKERITKYQGVALILILVGILLMSF
jgi:transporter family protein